MANIVSPVNATMVEQPKGFNNYMRAEEEFQTKKALALQDALLKKQQLDIMRQKQNEFDIDKVGQQAFIKASQGIELNPTEASALQYLDAKSPTAAFNPITGVMEQKPSLLQRAGLGNAFNPQPARTGQPATQFTPQQNAQLLDVFEPPAEPVVLNGYPNVPAFNTNQSPRSEQKLAEANIESGRKRVDEMIATASSAGAAKQAANTMTALLPDLGYTGTGANITAGIDKALTGIGLPNVVPGKPSARETFESQGVDAWVKAVEPLKGALTEREGARFDKAVSNLTTTPEGIKARARLTEALANRAREKSIFYEQYLSQNGTLTGADRIWSDWSEQNPVVTNELLGVQAPQLSKQDVAETIFNAKKAIKAGKPRDAIKQRLIDAGIDPAQAGL